MDGHVFFEKGFEIIFIVFVQLINWLFENEALTIWRVTDWNTKLDCLILEVEPVDECSILRINVLFVKSHVDANDACHRLIVLRFLPFDLRY